MTIARKRITHMRKTKYFGRHDNLAFFPPDELASLNNKRYERLQLQFIADRRRNFHQRKAALVSVIHFQMKKKKKRIINHSVCRFLRWKRRSQGQHCSGNAKKKFCRVNQHLQSTIDFSLPGYCKFLKQANILTKTEREDERFI